MSDDLTPDEQKFTMWGYAELEQRVAVAEHERDDAVENWKLDAASLRVAEERAEVAERMLEELHANRGQLDKLVSGWVLVHPDDSEGKLTELLRFAEQRAVLAEQRLHDTVEREQGLREILSECVADLERSCCGWGPFRSEYPVWKRAREALSALAPLSPVVGETEEQA